MTITAPKDIRRPYVNLLGHDSNAFAIMGTVSKALRRAGNSQAIVDAYLEEAKSGDHDHLIAVSLEFTTTDRAEGKRIEAEHKREQRQRFGPSSDRDAIASAFEALEGEGFITRAAQDDCGTCACAAIGREAAEHGVAEEAIADVFFAYFHQQDEEAFEVLDDGQEPCGSCGGSGVSQRECGGCDGGGTVELLPTGDGDGDGAMESCGDCEGTGVEEEDCFECGGDGYHEEEPTYGDRLALDLYIGFGPDEEAGRVVVEALEEAGCDTEWDGDIETRIKVVA